jgi:hypothetical protein
MVNLWIILLLPWLAMLWLVFRRSGSQPVASIPARFLWPSQSKPGSDRKGSPPAWAIVALLSFLPAIAGLAMQQTQTPEPQKPPTRKVEVQLTQASLIKNQLQLWLKAADSTGETGITLSYRDQILYSATLTDIPMGVSYRPIELQQAIPDEAEVITLRFGSDSDSRSHSSVELRPTQSAGRLTIDSASQLAADPNFQRLAAVVQNNPNSRPVTVVDQVPASTPKRLIVVQPGDQTVDGDFQSELPFAGMLTDVRGLRVASPPDGWKVLATFANRPATAVANDPGSGVWIGIDSPDLRGTPAWVAMMAWAYDFAADSPDRWEWVAPSVSTRSQAVSSDATGSPKSGALPLLGALGLMLAAGLCTFRV